jgi:hypothetical protein
MTTRTYCNGFVVRFLQDMTKDDIINMTSTLTQSLNEFYKNTTESYIVNVIIEPICGGGFLLIYEGQSSWYKSFRFQKCGFPWISENVREDWIHSEDVIFAKKSHINTYLKAFYNAPAWTVKELNIIRSCFHQYPTKCSKAKRPTSGEISLNDIHN